MNRTGSGREKPRFQLAIEAIDAVNSADPNPCADDPDMPASLDYARRMSRWLLRLSPDAPEALRLAARAQHIGRWKRPRADYPVRREGYLRWRKDLADYHAETAAGILSSVGYDSGTIDRVTDLILKKNLKRDADAQALEDAACLTFLESQFTAFSRKHPDDKVIDILIKTAAKMSPAGLALAMTLAAGLPADRLALVERALGHAAPNQPGQSTP